MNKKIINEIYRQQKIMGVTNPLLRENTYVTLGSDLIKSFINTSKKVIPNVADDVLVGSITVNKKFLDDIFDILEDPSLFGALGKSEKELFGQIVAQSSDIVDDIYEKLMRDVIDKTGKSEKDLINMISKQTEGGKTLSEVLNELNGAEDVFLNSVLIQKISKKIRDIKTGKFKTEVITSGKVNSDKIKLDNESYMKILRKGFSSGAGYPSMFKLVTNLNTKLGPEYITGWRYLLRYLTTQTPVNLELKKCFRILVENGFSEDFAKQITYKIGQLGGNAFVRAWVLVATITFLRWVWSYIEQQGGEEYVNRMNENEAKLLWKDITENIYLVDSLSWFIPFSQLSKIIMGMTKRKPALQLLKDIALGNTDEEKELKKIDPNFTDTENTNPEIENAKNEFIDAVKKAQENTSNGSNDLKFTNDIGGLVKWLTDVKKLSLIDEDLAAIKSVGNNTYTYEDADGKIHKYKYSGNTFQ